MSSKRNQRRKEKVRRHMGSGLTNPGDVDFVEFPIGYMARNGRLIEVWTTATLEEHAAIREEFRSTGVERRQRCEANRARLLEILIEADPVDVLGSASLICLQNDPTPSTVSEAGPSLTHIEYLALQALGVGLDAPDRSDPKKSLKLALEALELVRAIFDDTQMLMVISEVESRSGGMDNQLADYRLRTRLESLGVRGSGYGEHLARVIHGCFDSFEVECRELLGFTADDALKIIQSFGDVFSGRLERRRETAVQGREETLIQLKRARSAGGNVGGWPASLLRLPQREAKERVNMMVLSFIYADERALVVMKPEEVAAVAGIDNSVVNAFFEAFCCPPDAFDERYHAHPFGAHPLTERPVLRVSEGFIVPVPQTMLEWCAHAWRISLLSTLVSGIVTRKPEGASSNVRPVNFSAGRFLAPRLGLA